MGQGQTVALRTELEVRPHRGTHTLFPSVSQVGRWAMAPGSPRWHRLGNTATCGTRGRGSWHVLFLVGRSSHESPAWVPSGPQLDLVPVTAPESMAGLGEWGAVTGRVWGLTAPRELCSTQSVGSSGRSRGPGHLRWPLCHSPGVGVHSQPALRRSQGALLWRDLQEPGACTLP